MAASEKKHGFMHSIKDTLCNFSQIISGSIFPSIAQGTEMVMKTIEERAIKIEKRLLRKLSSLLVIGLGGVFLIFALFFFLIEFLHWGNALACFSIGITIFVIGLLLKLAESDK